MSNKLSGKKRRILIRTVVLLFPFISILLLYVLTPYIIEFMWNAFGVCPFYKYTGMLCPACGNTRSITSLMRGDIFSALKYNITPVLLLILGVGGYIEILFRVFDKKIKLLPRNLAFYLTLIALMMVYYVLRNFMPIIGAIN